MISVKRVIFVTPRSKEGERASMDKYAFQMVTSLEEAGVSCGVLPVKVNVSHFKRLILPLFSSWKLLFCKEKIIYIHYAFFINFIFLLPFLVTARFLFRKKIVLQIHEFWEFLPMKNIVKHVDLLYCRVANSIVVHNNEQFDILKSKGYKNVYLLHMPIEIVEKTEIKTANNLNNREVKLLMHGGIIRKKGYEVGIKALSLLPPYYTMTIIGGSWDKIYFGELLSLIKDLGVLDRVSIIDNYLPEVEYEEYIKHSDILVYPYTISTASAALAEGALKFGKPFLTSDIKSFISYLGTNEFSFISGNYEDLAKKIISLNLNDIPSFIKEIHKKYSWGNTGHYLKDIIINL